MSQEDFQKELSGLRKEIINFQKEQAKARDDINKLRIGATNKLISQLSPILQEYAKKNSVSRIIMTSSVASVYMTKNLDTEIDESCWTDTSNKDLDAYTKSKTLAERSAWDYVSKFNENNNHFRNYNRMIIDKYNLLRYKNI